MKKQLDMFAWRIALEPPPKIIGIPQIPVEAPPPPPVSGDVWLDPTKYWICHGCHTKWLNGDKCRYCK